MQIDYHHSSEANKFRGPLLIASTLVCLSLAACGNKEDKKVATQVAAKVGAEEISVHQINQVLSRTQTAGVTPQTAQTLRKEVLEKLIDQQVAVDQATELKLNRSPEVVAQIEAARREVLARAYVQQLANGLPKPGADETRKYYLDHPQLFAERRVFNLQEIVIPAANSAAVEDQLNAQVGAGKSMEEIATWLKAKDVKFGSGSATRPAEQIPLGLLARIHVLRNGQTTIIESPQGATVLRVVSSQSAPVVEASALPRIEQFLSNQRGAAAVAQNIRELRSKTKVAYLGDFSQPTAAEPSAAQPTIAVPSLPAQRLLNAEVGDAGRKAAIEKGIAGLK